MPLLLISLLLSIAVPRPRGSTHHASLVEYSKSRTPSVRGEARRSPTFRFRVRRQEQEQEQQMGLGSCCCRCLEILCAILLPPLGVCLRHGCCSMEFWISVLLTILGYLPGILYAVYVIVSVDPDRVRRGDDDYVYVA